jgi:hypothetical protein
MPSPLENDYISESYDKHFEKLKEMVIEIATKHFKADSN